MLNWDDLRFFLETARQGSLSAAARALGVNQSTVSRRIASFEAKLETRLFDRLPSGYAPTEAGTALIDMAERVENEVSAMERQVSGENLNLRGVLRVTAADITTTRFLLPHLKAFAEAYPEIKLDLVSTYSHLSLSRREADVAIRVAKKVPETLVGRRIARISQSFFIAADLYDALGGQVDPEAHPWVGWENEEWNQYQFLNRFPKAVIRFRTNSALVMIDAVKAGFGIGALACYHSDAEPELRRIVPFSEEVRLSMWLLTHPDLRRTARVRMFMDFMSERLERERDLIEGRRSRVVDRSG